MLAYLALLPFKSSRSQHWPIDQASETEGLEPHVLVAGLHFGPFGDLQDGADRLSPFSEQLQTGDIVILEILKPICTAVLQLILLVWR